MGMTASIDVGSNSLRLLICEREGLGLNGKQKQKITTRLGGGISEDGLLDYSRIEASLDALGEFKNICEKEGVEEIIAFATSAVREARNGDYLVKMAKQEHGIDIRVISGKEEAEIGFLGAFSQFEQTEENRVLIDVGGSSTEISFAKGSEIEYSKSFQVGAVRYLNDFFSGADELNGAKMAMRDIEDKIEPAFDYIISKFPAKVVIIGGTATTIAMHSLGIDMYDAEKVEGHVLKISEIKDMLDKVFMTEPEKRKEMVGVEPQRSEIILQGLLITEFILTSIGAKEVVVSDSDSLEGAIIKYGKCEI